MQNMFQLSHKVLLVFHKKKKKMITRLIQQYRNKFKLKIFSKKKNLSVSRWLEIFNATELCFDLLIDIRDSFVRLCLEGHMTCDMK